MSRRFLICVAFVLATTYVLSVGFYFFRSRRTVMVVGQVVSICTSSTPILGGTLYAPYQVVVVREANGRAWRVGCVGPWEDVGLPMVTHVWVVVVMRKKRSLVLGDPSHFHELVSARVR